MQSLFRPPLDPWRVQQLTLFLTSLNRGERSDRPNTPLENLCLLEEPILEIYKILIDPPEDCARIPSEILKRSRHYISKGAMELYLTFCPLLLNSQPLPRAMLQNPYKVVQSSITITKNVPREDE